MLHPIEDRAGAVRAGDEARTRFLSAQGYRVLRFWNHDVLGNTDGVIEQITAALAGARATRP